MCVINGLINFDKLVQYCNQNYSLAIKIKFSTSIAFIKIFLFNLMIVDLNS